MPIWMDYVLIVLFVNIFTVCLSMHKYNNIVLIRDLLACFCIDIIMLVHFHYLVLEKHRLAYRLLFTNYY